MITCDRSGILLTPRVCVESAVFVLSMVTEIFEILTLILSVVHVSLTIGELQRLDILYCSTMGIVLLTKQFEFARDHVHPPLGFILE